MSHYVNLCDKCWLIKRILVVFCRRKNPVRLITVQGKWKFFIAVSYRQKFVRNVVSRSQYSRVCSEQAGKKLNFIISASVPFFFKIKSVSKIVCPWKKLKDNLRQKQSGD